MERVNTVKWNGDGGIVDNVGRVEDDDDDRANSMEESGRGRVG